MYECLEFVSSVSVKCMRSMFESFGLVYLLSVLRPGVSFGAFVPVRWVQRMSGRFVGVCDTRSVSLVNPLTV